MPFLNGGKGRLIPGRGGPSSLLISLVAYWKLDEVSAGSWAVTRNDSVGVSHLTDNNTIASAAGIVGNSAALVTADSTYFSKSSVAALQTGDIDMTFAFWYYPTNFADGSILFKKWGGSTSEYLVQTYANGKMLLYFGSKYIDGAGPLTQSAWNLIIFYHDSTNDVIGVHVNNGVAKTTATAGAYPSAGTSAFQMGGLPAPNGFIDEFGIWKRLLTSPEKIELWNSGGGKQYPF
jgi:hypothetical protein